MAGFRERLLMLAGSRRDPSAIEELAREMMEAIAKGGNPFATPSADKDFFEDAFRDFDPFREDDPIGDAENSFGSPDTDDGWEDGFASFDEQAPRPAESAQNPGAPTEDPTAEPPLAWMWDAAKPVVLQGHGDLTRDESNIIGYFLRQLALTIEARGIVLDSGALSEIVDNLRPGAPNVLVIEPWMSTNKLKAAEAIQLGRRICSKALQYVGFARLLDAGLCMDAPKTQERLFERLSRGDRESLDEFRRTLSLIDDHGARTMAASVDYVLACLGHRDAMRRMADRIGELRDKLKKDDFSPEIDERLFHKYTIVADNWQRLGAGSGGIEELLVQKIAVEWFDFTRVYKFEMRFPGFTFPSATDSVRYSFEALRNGANRKSGTVAANVQEDSDKEGWPHVTVLDRIAGGEKGDETKAEYSRLLQPLPLYPAPDPDALYRDLMREFPWMEEANRQAAFSSALARRNQEGGFRLPPLLLTGAPGVGKSRWARRFSELTGVPLYSDSLAGEANSMSVRGSSKGWSNARPSLPAVALRSTEAANPVLLVDEVDKATASHNGDPIGAMLPMLDKETARRYPDICLLGSLDVSRISWVFTANSASSLSQPFLDRVKVVNVPKPTIRHYPAIVNSLVDEAMSEFAVGEEEAQEMIEDIRKEGMTALECGKSIRAVGASIRDRMSKLVWSPPEVLKLVQ